MISEKRIAIARVLFFIVAAALTGLGIVYNVKNELMPYHLQFLGKPFSSLDPKVQFLLMQAMKLIGGMAIASAAVLAILTSQLGKGMSWIRWAILIMMTILFAAFIRVTLSIGLHTPWWGPLVLYFITIAGFVLSRDAQNVKS